MVEIKVSLMTLMHSTPCPPYKDIERRNEAPQRDNMSEISNSKRILTSTILKMINNTDFWREQLNNSFFDDFQNYQKNSKKIDYRRKKYSWSSEMIIAFWAIMASYRLYDSNKFTTAVDIGTQKARTVEDLLIKTCMSEQLKSKNNERKMFIIKLRGNPRVEFNDVMDHVECLGKCLALSLANGVLDWSQMYKDAGFPNYFSNYNHNLYPTPIELNHTEFNTSIVESYIINSFYPSADDEIPKSRQYQATNWQISQTDITTVTNNLAAIDLSTLSNYKQNELRKIITKINNF